MIINKKTVAAVCAACIMIFGILAAAEENKNDFGLLNYLGIELAEDFDNSVSRGEFTAAAVRLLGFDNDPGGLLPFWDVNEDNPYRNEIYFACNTGIIKGDSGESFRTYENIKYIDALAVLVRVCGYEAEAEKNGGYPGGYLSAAGGLGIFASKRQLDDEISYRDMYELLMLTLEADSCRDIIMGRESDDDETVLSRYHNIEKAKGVVNSDEYACLLGYSVCNENEAVVGDEYYSLGAGIDVSDMLGLFAEVYYREKDGERIAVHIKISPNKNRETKILSENIAGFSGGYLSYFENGRTKRVKVSSTVSVIYNGKSIDYSRDFNDSLFDITDGEVVLIDNGSGGFSVIKISEYKNIAVKYADKENYVLYDKFSSQIIDLNAEKDSHVRIKVTDSEGNPKQFADIAKDDILTVAQSRDGEIVTIIISRRIENAVIKSIGEGDNGTVITTENGSFTFTGYAENNPDIKLKTGENAALYLNYAGKIVGITYSDTNRRKLGYVLNIYVDDGDDLPVLKLVTEAGETPEIHAAAGVRVDGASVKTDYQSVFNSGMKYQLIAYELNSDGRISRIDTSVYNSSLEKDDSLFLRSRYEDTGSLAYKSPDRTFNGRVSINEDTFMVEVPDDRTKYSDYRVLTYSDLTNTNTYKVDTYSFTCDSPLADGVVIYSMENSIKPKDNEFLSMVKSIYMSLNDEEEECLTLDIQRGDSIFTAYVTDEEMIPLFSGVEKGDIIRYGVNYKSEIIRFQWVYDYSEKQVKLERNPTNTDYSSGSSRIIGAYVYMNDNGYIRIGNDMANAGDGNLETYLSSKVKQYTVDENHEMKVIAQEEVRAYKDYGSGGDYCLIQSYYGDIRTVIYIR